MTQRAAASWLAMRLDFIGLVILVLAGESAGAMLCVYLLCIFCLQ